VRDAHAVRRAEGKRAGQPPMLRQDLRERIAAEYAQGKTQSAIARELNAENIPAARGGQWFPATVAHILRSVALDSTLAANSSAKRTALTTI
jgi:hypothetical protein